MRKKALSWLLAVAMVLSLFVSAPLTAAASVLPGAVFSDGDLDRVYFSGDTLTFNLSGMPVGMPLTGIPAGTTLRVSLGIVDASSTFHDYTLFNTSGLTTEDPNYVFNGQGDNTGWYLSRTLNADGTLSSTISGTIVTTPPPILGVAAVKIYVNTGSVWQNFMEDGNPTTPDFIPLTADSKPATVGLDGVMVMPEGITSNPILGSGAQNAEDLRSMNISFTKTVAAGITGTIAFSGLNLMDSSSELAGLDDGLIMDQVASPAEGALSQFVMGIDDTTISYLASKGATISVSSESFNTFTTDGFNVAAVGVGGGTVSGLAFNDATDTVSFNVTHFSSYTLTQEDPNYIGFFVSKTDVTTEGGIDGSITVTSPSGGGGTYEYSYDNGSTWVSDSAKTGLTAGTYQVKVRDAANIANVSAAQEVIILQPVTPAAPAVTRDDTANTVSGMATGMEYDLDSAGYVAYDAATFSAIDFSGNHTLLVRVAAVGINPAGAITTLTFTINPPDLDNNYLISTGTNIDAAADGVGNIYAVYENSGTIYFAKNRQNQEEIPGGGSDSAASIAVQSDGTAHVVFVRSGSVTYAKRDLSGSWTVTAVSSGSSPDIAVDSSGYAHLVYLMNPGDYDDVMYSNNTSGLFAATLVYDGYYWYDGGGRSANYFSNPSIKVDSSGKYHISAVIHVINGGMGWTDHNYTICYTTNSGAAGSDAGYFGNNASVTQNRRSMVMKNDTPALIYSTGSGTYYYPSSLLVDGASAPAAAAYGTRMGIAYNSSGVKYIFDNGAGFSGPADIDASGSNPAAAVDGTYSYVYYEKGGSVYLATDNNVAPPYSAELTDDDLDSVYFADNTMSFNLAGLNSLDGQTVRVAFGTVSDGGVFTPAAVVGGLTANADGVQNFTSKTVSGGVLASDVTGTVQSGLGIGVTAVKVYYESAPGTWTNLYSALPQPYMVLTNGPHPAYTGIALPVGIASSPILGAGAQNAENLYNINIAFEKTIDDGITGKISFTGLDLISNKGQLASLASAITMQKEANPGVGALEKYTLGVDVGSLAFLSGKGSTVSVTAAAFDGLTAADFTAASADVSGGSVSGLAFDDATDTVSFTVNHFSNYSLTRIDPADANADGYYDADVATICTFLELPSSTVGQKNGDVVRGSTYNPNDPGSYNNVTWTLIDGYYRATAIIWDSVHGYNAGALSGTFDVRPLTELTSLTLEGTDADGVTAITVAGMTKLVTLHIRENALTSLSVAGCTALSDLDCQENALTSLTLTGVSELTGLNCGYNQLTSVNMTGLSKLEKIWVYYNQLTSLDVTPFALLKDLDCQGNLLTSLNLSGNPLLTSLYCGTNSITTLDLTGKSALASLGCEDCGLTTLTMTGCTALTYIYCPGNNLASLNLTGITGLADLYCNGNKLAFSALPASLPVLGGSYVYAPQQTIPVSLTNGNRIDLSSEELFDGNHTLYTWYKAVDNSVITSGIDVPSAGVFIFDRATFAGIGVYCTMSNASYPGFTGGDALRTTTAVIQSLPQCGAPIPAISGTDVSWSAADGAAEYRVQIYNNDGITPACAEISIIETSIDLALLPGDAVQTLPGGIYKVKVYAVGNNTTHCDSDWSTLSNSVTLSLSPLELATASVEAAEATPTQANVDAAQTLVSALPAGAAKTALQSRINTVQGAVDAAAALTVQTAIAALPAAGDLLLTDTAVSAARNAYDSLTAAQKLLVTNYAVLTAAETQLTVLGAAAAAVGTAEATPTQDNVDTAQTLVSALPAGAAKTALQSRINTVQGAVDAAAALTVQTAIAALPAAGNLLLTDTAVSAARNAYDSLTAAQKLLVTNYAVLTAAETQLTVLGAAAAAVGTAEATPTQDNVDTAQTLVSALPVGAAKTALQSRIDAVQNIINAVFSVEAAEATPTQANVNAAQTLVSALPAGAAKTALQSRIDAVQTNLEAEAVSAINAADATTISSVITAYAGTLGLNLTDFNALTDKTPVYNALTGKAFLNKASIKAAFDAAVSAEKAAETPSGGGGGTTVPAGQQVTISTPDGTTGVTGTLTESGNTAQVTISGTQFGQIAGTDQGAVIPLPSATVTFDPKAVNTINGTSSMGDAVLTVEKVDPSTLSEDQQKRVGDRPVYDFTLTKGGQQISSFGGGHAEISIPYTLKPGENPNQVVIYYLADDGSLKTMRGHYDTGSKCVVFETTHFSKYAIGYNQVSFSDVASNAWYKNAVDFIAARGITSGTGNGAYSPDAPLTRGQFVVLLMNAYGISTDSVPVGTANFTDAGNTYYTNYLLAAKSLGIVNGIGNNMFAPEQAITRQEMFVMLYNALKVIGELPAASGTKQLSDFGDTNQISSWAQEAMNALVKGGIISGSNGMLNPTSSTTRAEMAQMLYNLLSK